MTTTTTAGNKKQTDTTQVKNLIARLTFKQEEGEITAVFATLNVIDLDGDVILPGAFADQAVKLSAWQHDWRSLPAGKGTISEVGEEAVFEGMFFLDTTNGRETYQTVKNLDELTEWSFGFNIIAAEYGVFDEQPVRFLQSLDVIEVSPVMRGAGINTRTEDIKSCQSCAEPKSDPEPTPSETPPDEPPPSDPDDDPDDDMKGRRLGTLVRRLRASRGMTNIQLGEQAGITTQSIRRIINGELRCPGLRRLRRLSSVLNVSMSSLREAAEADGCRYQDPLTASAEDITTSEYAEQLEDILWTRKAAQANLEEYQQEMADGDENLRGLLETLTPKDAPVAAPVPAEPVPEPEDAEPPEPAAPDGDTPVPEEPSEPDAPEPAQPDAPEPTPADPSIPTEPGPLETIDQAIAERRTQIEG